MGEREETETEGREEEIKIENEETEIERMIAKDSEQELVSDDPCPQVHLGAFCGLFLAE